MLRLANVCRDTPKAVKLDISNLVFVLLAHMTTKRQDLRTNSVTDACLSLEPGPRLLNTWIPTEARILEIPKLQSTFHGGSQETVPLKPWQLRRHWAVAAVLSHPQQGTGEVNGSLCG